MGTFQQWFWHPSFCPEGGDFCWWFGTHLPTNSKILCFLRGKIINKDKFPTKITTKFPINLDRFGMMGHPTWGFTPVLCRSWILWPTTDVVRSATGGSDVLGFFGCLCRTLSNIVEPSDLKLYIYIYLVVWYPYWRFWSSKHPSAKNQAAEPPFGNGPVGTGISELQKRTGHLEGR